MVHCTHDGADMTAFKKWVSLGRQTQVQVRWQKRAKKPQKVIASVCTKETRYAYCLSWICLGQSYTKLTFFTEACMMLCFAFVAKTALIAQHCFGYC